MFTRKRLLASTLAALLLATAASPAMAATTPDPEVFSFIGQALIPAETTVTAPVTANANIKILFPTVLITSTPSLDTKLTRVLQAGSERTAGLLGHPLAVLIPTSPFSHRVSPITGQAGEFHTGQDYGSPCGTDVRAAAEGTVVFTGWHLGGGGNRVEIDHGNGLKTTYNHLLGYQVTEGQHVSRGQSIANVGTTGSSTGCHLHFEVWHHGIVTAGGVWGWEAPGFSRGEG